MKTCQNFSEYGNDLELTIKDVERCTHIGDCYEDVCKVAKKPYIKAQTKTWDKDNLVRELLQYGAWEESELENHEENIIKWIWISADNILDNK